MTNVFDSQTPESVDPLVYAREKFKNDQGEIDLEKLARAKLESDRFIERLQNETNELRSEVKARIGLEEFLTKMNNPPKNENEQTPQGNQPQPAPSSLDIEQLVEQQLTKAQANRVKADNQKRVNDTLTQIWGSDTAKNFSQVAQALNMSTDELRALAERSPDAFFRVAGISNTPNTPPVGQVPRGTVQVGVTGATPERNFEYYRQLKKTDPKTYFSTKTQLQMHQDGARLGEKFFN